MRGEKELRRELSFLSDLTAAVARASIVLPGEGVAGSPANTTGASLVRPGGRQCYPAFWIRDFTMSLDSGVFPAGIIIHAARVTAQTQAEEDHALPTGGFVPRGAIADHVRFDGAPIYYAGTYEAEKQGGEPWGRLPCFDDHYYFVRMVRRAVETGGVGLLADSVRGMTMLERLHLAFGVPPVSAGTEIVCCTEENRGVNFGFMDGVRQTGQLFFASVLRCIAAQDMSWLCRQAGLVERAVDYEGIAARLREQIPATFAAPSGLMGPGLTGSGLMRAATGLSGQPDVWGTALAVSSGVLSGAAARAASERLAAAYREGTLSWKGNVRHVLVTDDFSRETCWESALPRKNTYQNGAYWGTPVGWVADAIARVEPRAARDLFVEYVQELREGDFRKGEEYGSPWECMHPDGAHAQNPVYLASVACPLPDLRRLFP